MVEWKILGDIWISIEMQIKCREFVVFFYHTTQQPTVEVNSYNNNESISYASICIRWRYFCRNSSNVIIAQCGDNGSSVYVAPGWMHQFGVGANVQKKWNMIEIIKFTKTMKLMCHKMKWKGWMHCQPIKNGIFFKFNLCYRMHFWMLFILLIFFLCLLQIAWTRTYSCSQHDISNE